MFAAADGSESDADGKADGWITVRLTSMRPLEGNPHPPATTAAGDLILLVEPGEMRSAAIEVEP